MPDISWAGAVDPDPDSIPTIHAWRARLRTAFLALAIAVVPCLVLYVVAIFAVLGACTTGFGCLGPALIAMAAVAVVASVVHVVAARRLGLGLPHGFFVVLLSAVLLAANLHLLGPLAATAASATVTLPDLSPRGRLLVCVLVGALLVMLPEAKAEMYRVIYDF